MKTAKTLIEKLTEWLGIDDYKKIINIYNSQKELPRGYRMKYQDPWCAAGLSAAVIETGMVDIIGTECSCEKFIDIFRAKSIWIEDGKITPKTGDIILYNWDSNVQPNDGRADHIGVVTNVLHGVIHVIECNYNNSVGVRAIEVGNGKIRGFARPPYDKENVRYKDNDTLADEVIRGLWGNGVARKKKLEEAGYNYYDIQELVNSRLAFKKSITTIANEVIKGLWGNGKERKDRLTKAGYSYTLVQEEVNRILRG